jgi:hypothetical protein
MGMAEGVGPEFKSQFQKKRVKIKKLKTEKNTEKS